MFKKAISTCIIILYILNISWVGINTTYSYFSVASNFKLSNNAASTISLVPGQTFSLDIGSSNDLAESIKNVFVKFSFGNNAGFSYKGLDQRSRINGAVVTNPVPSSAYDSVSGFSYEITNASNPNVLAAQLFDFARASNSHTGFVVSNNISTYQNNLNAYFEAKKVSDSSLVTGTVGNKILYVNVKPHIVDYSFSKSSIVGNGSDSTDLTVKVKDYNGCTNLDGGIITANLSSLGLSSNESISYISCEADGKTAVFQKNITSLVSTGDKTFAYSDFTAKDENDNYTDPNDANTAFDDEDKKTSLTLTIATPIAPVVTIASTTPSIVGARASSTVSFSADKAGTYKVVVNGNGSCSAGTVVTDWIAYATGVTINSSVAASSLSEGSNTIYTCVKSDIGDIGSANTIITKDIVAPVISSVGLSPASVVANDSTLSFYCNEDGDYKVVMNSFDTGYQALVKDVKNSVILTNGNINNGTNIVNVYCRDTAGNESNANTSISKVSPPPTMSSSGLSLLDNDSSWDGVDGRDFKVTWDSAIGLAYSGFESYRIYLLPENTAFTGIYLGLVADSGSTSWTGTSSLTTDSLGNPLAGGNYVAYVTIMGTSGQIGTPVSVTGTMIADIISHPSILSASFTSTGNLRVKFDSPLKTDLSWSYATGFTYQVSGTSYTGSSVSSVSNDTIDVSIPSLASTASVGTLSISTGAVTGLASDGAYNNFISSVPISDNISPSVAFSTGTISLYNGFYSSNLTLNYTTSEILSSSGLVKIDFISAGGNSSTLKTIYISNPSELTAGAHSKIIDLISLGLVSGAYYDVILTSLDLYGNTSQSTIYGIKFDNTAPSIVSINPFGPNKVFGAPAPLSFTWLSATDDSGNGSGVKGYKLRVFQGTQNYNEWKTCTGTYTDYDPDGSLINLSRAITMANLYNYAWGVYAYDNMGNTGALSTCDNFYTNTQVPYLGTATIKDSSINSTSYAKGGNTLEVTATITNSDTSHIWLDASSIKDSSYANISCASPVSGVTCTYNSNIATYTFTAGAGAGLVSGTKSLSFSASNTAGVNTGTLLVSTTLDNANPAISSINLSSSVFGGTSMPIDFTPATDNIGVNYLKFEYSDNNGGTWNLISTGANSSPYTWDITSIPTGANYKIKITAYDMVGNTLSAESAVFSIDKVAPTMNNPLTAPISGKIKGGATTNITWNSSDITDAGGFKTNPITLYYSVDGNIFYQIATNIAKEAGTYAWSVPASTDTTNTKIKITAEDSVGNIATFTGASFEIDSISPTISVTYAGDGGSTPLSNRYINNSGIDISASIADTNLAGGTVSYSFYNQTANTYWNGTTWTGATEVINTLATATGANYSLSSTIYPTITNGNTYKLKLRATDVVGNAYANPLITYIGDIIAPNISTITASGTYISGSINISGTSSDNLSTVSSVKLEIKKGSQYWDGTTWSLSPQTLNVSTGDNYANWNYVFNMPLSDNDLDNYVVTVTAYDKAYKTNNLGTSIISLIKDTAGPSIGEPLFTFSTGGIKKGGDNLSITWNPALLTDSGAGVNTNSVKLEYWNGTAYVLIADNLANSGSYNWTIATIDTNSRIRLSAKDNIGNTSNSVISDSFIVDSLPPSISTVETADNDANGQIDGFVVTFSENVTGVTGSGFTMSDGSIISSVASTLDPKIYEFHFSNSGTTASIPSLIYAGTFVKDIAGNNLANVTKTSIDKASPRLTGVSVYDTNSNGKLDKIEITTSENIASTTTLNGFTLENPKLGMTMSSLSVSTNKINIVLAESTDIDTSTGSLALTLNNAIYTDTSSNLAGNLNSFAVSDRAIPVLVSSATIDSNTNYKMDKFELTYSENISGAVLGNFAISNMSAGASTTGMTINSNKLDFAVSETSSDNDSSVRPRLNYSAGIMQDASGNTGAVLTNYDVSDGIAPKITGRTTIDSDSNGKVDRVKLSFSEAIAGSLASFNTTLDTYTVSSYSFSGTTDVLVNLSEKPIYDTDATPTIRVLSNTSLTDLAGNFAINEASPVSVVDGVGIIISAARYEASSHRIYVTYSETINPSDFTTSNFVLANAGAYTVTGTGNDSAGDYIVLSGETINYAISTISFTANSVRDALGNKQIATHYVSLSAPIIINEVMKSLDSNNDYIELRNLSENSVDISNWIIAGVTIPGATTISASGYYLISKTVQATSIINVVPDLVSASLNLGATSINLNNGSINLDTAKLDTGLNDTITPASLERKSDVGNGLLASSWYTAVASVGFDNSTPKGTPKRANIIDAVAPTLTSPLADSTLFPLGIYNLVYDYSDNIAINTGSIVFSLQKWNGTSYDTISSGYTTGAISTAQSNFYFANLAYGKYKTTFSIADTSANISNIVREFYVDKLEFDISTGAINIGKLDDTQDIYATTTMNVTVKTLGAGFDLNLAGSGTLDSGINSIGRYNGLKGFGFDYAESGISTKAYSGVLQQINNTALSSYSTGNIDVNGNQKTYTYQVKYGARIEPMQVAGNYSGAVRVSLGLNY